MYISIAVSHWGLKQWNYNYGHTPFVFFALQSEPFYMYCLSTVAMTIHTWKCPFNDDSRPVWIHDLCFSAVIFAQHVIQSSRVSLKIGLHVLTFCLDLISVVLNTSCYFFQVDGVNFL